MKTPNESINRLLLEDPFVFLSYAKEDQSRVLKFYHKLFADNLKPWMDVHNIPPGYEWANLISNTIRKSRFFLVFLSNKSVNKTGFIQKEITDALKVVETQPEGQVFVIPVRLEECDVPERIAKWHWIDIYKYGGYKKLRDTLIHRLGSTYRLPTPHRIHDDIAETPEFKLKSDYLIYEHFAQISSFVYGKISARKYVISDGRFLETRSSIPSSFMKLKSSCSRFSKLSAEAFQRVMPASSVYRHEANKIVSVQKSDELRLSLRCQKEKLVVGVNPFYWNYFQLRFPDSTGYIFSPESPIIFEKYSEIVALIMPMRLT